ncbi:MAG: TonB-dependent receptor [Opitutaceae bacterium]|nr:TonB-dependent receptor [Opitutaceae bacterium]
MSRLIAFALPVWLAAQEPALELPRFVAYSGQVANQTPTAALAMPVSGLRFEPRVDVQARNLAEGQADIAVRGGLFENTGFKVGALALFDPQTGHYFAEIPIAPAMLTAPRVLTGAENAVEGFNAGVGTIAYGWRPVVARGEVSAAFGNYGTNRQAFYQGYVFPAGDGGAQAAVDLDLARSVSDGSQPFGDHDFRRAAGRLQFRGADTQTDFFAGRQRKFFGWPNLYTPFGFNETEFLRTDLYLINHRVGRGPDDFWQVGASYRRNYDDYEFNRAVPGASNPFVHTTRVRAVALEGREDYGGYVLAYNLRAMRDDLESTSLTAGRFRTRDYAKAALVPERSFATARGRLTLRAGAAYDDTNRDEAAVSPVAEAVLETAAGARLHLQYAESTQVPTYTALNSSATSGLFRGNANLGRETSRNLEAGGAFGCGGWRIEAAVFRRWDDDLVDWTFARGVTARTANAVDVATSGLELVAARRTARYELVLGYTWLDKDADYGSAAVDASFYALNFARHRVTAAAVARLGGGWEVRSDNEYRRQEKNLLRVAGGREAWLSALGLYYLPPRIRGLEIALLLDNVWDSEFQEVPAVPAARRQYTAGATYRW